MHTRPAWVCRFGNLSAQFKTFWDSTGQLWMKQELDGKPFSLVTSSASQGGGQESTFLAGMHPLIWAGTTCSMCLGREGMGQEHVRCLALAGAFH